MQRAESGSTLGSNESNRSPATDPDDLLAAIHGVTADKQIYRGARCIRFVGLRMPLVVPIALFLWIPGVIWIAEKFYQRVSQNRYLLSRLFGCKEACAIMPSRKRQQDVEARP